MAQRGPGKDPGAVPPLVPAPAPRPLAAEAALQPISPAATRVPATLSPSPTTAALLVGLRRRWLLALVLGAVCAAGTGIGMWTFFPAPGYQVGAMVHLASAPEAGLLGRPAADTDAKFASYQKTQMTLVKSQTVLTAALKDPKVAVLPLVRRQSSPREWLAEHLELDFKQGPEILRISMKGESPDEMALIVDAVMKAYLDEVLESEEGRRKVRLGQLEELKVQHEKLLTEKRKKLAAYAPKLGGDTRLAGGMQEFKLKQLGLATEELQGLQTEKRKLQLLLKGLEAKAGGAREAHVPPALVQQDVDGDVQVKEYLAQITKLETDIANLRKKAASPKVAEALLLERGTPRALQVVRDALDARIKTVREKSAERLRVKMLDDSRADLAQARDKLALIDGQATMVGKIIENLNRESKAVGEEVFQMTLSAREVEEEEKLVGTVVGEIRTLKLQSLSPPRAKMLDRAVAMKSSEGKKKLILTAGATCGALALALLGVGWWEFRKRRIESVDEVICGFGVDLVGTLPVLSRRALRRGRRAPGPGMPGRWSEAIDSFRTLLLRGDRASKARIVMVTSAMQGEGKTSLSCHLAVSLARSGRKTLLIDGDLRHPTVHRLFNLARAPGLGEIIKGTIDPLAAVQATPIPRFSILPAGEFDLAAVYALPRGDLQGLLERLGQQFDVIVVDSCPVLPVADTLHMAMHVDGVILSILRLVSRMPKVSAALHRLRLVGIPILGAVVSGTEEEVYGSRYHVAAPPES